MILCPLCGAENPDGSKICAKCSTELPKPENTAPAKEKAQGKAAAKPHVRITLKDLSRDFVDLLWLLLILLLILIGFLGESTNWTFQFAQVEKPIQIGALVALPPKRVQHPQKIYASRPQQYKRSFPRMLGIHHEIPITAHYLSPEELYRESRTQFNREHYDRSLSLLKHALQIDPTFSKAYFGLGYIYSFFSMKNTAVRMYQMALRFDPQNTQAINNLGIIYMQSGNFHYASQFLKQAVSLEPHNAAYQYNLGSLLIRTGHFHGAMQALRASAQLHPSDITYNDLAITYEHLGKVHEAESSWRQVLHLSKNPILIKQATSHLQYLQTYSG